MDHISVQTENFSQADCYSLLHNPANTEAKYGAVVTFTGIVRDFSKTKSLKALELEQYPAMTKLAMQNLVSTAKVKFDIGYVVLIHRVGYLAANEQIVFVGVSSIHRKAAFDAAQFLMDRLKNDVPLWKKEIDINGNEQWVEAKDSDIKAGEKWSTD